MERRGGTSVKRRTVLTLLGAGAVAWPFSALPQPSGLPVVGFLTSRAPGADAHLLVAFRAGLQEMGYDEGRSVAIAYRFAENQYDRLPALAADLVRQQVTLIVANG